MGKRLDYWFPEHITTGFVGECCGVSHVTVLQWIKNGYLPAFRLPAGYYRVCRDALIEFMTRHNIPVRREITMERHDP